MTAEVMKAAQGGVFPDHSNNPLFAPFLYHRDSSRAENRVVDKHKLKNA